MMAGDARGVVCLFLFCLTVVCGGCELTGRRDRSVSPDTARRELFLRGHDYNEREFLTQAGEGDVRAVKLFIAAGMSSEVRNAEGATPLIVAARNGQAKVVRALLEAGADINAQDREGQTALMRAITQGSVESARALLERGADTNLRTRKG